MSTYIYVRRAETLTRHLRPMPDLLPAGALPRQARERVVPVRALAIRRGPRATRAAITRDDLDPVELKGIPEPVPLWRVVSARSIAEGRDTDTQTPFVGRGRQLQLLETDVREGP